MQITKFISSYGHVFLRYALLPLFCLTGTMGNAQTDLAYFLEAAERGLPQLTDFANQREIAALESDKLAAAFTKPRVYVSADYLFAPYFADRGRFFAVTSTPDAKAIGYDAGVTNGGLISGQLNVEYQLLRGPRLAPLLRQQQIRGESVTVQRELFLAEQRRSVTAAFLQAYLLQSRVDFNGRVRERLVEKRDLVRKLADRGVMRVTDLVLLNLELKNLDFQNNELDVQYRQALLGLCSLVGLGYEDIQRLEPVTADEFRTPTEGRSIFLRSYALDSVAAIVDQEVFEADYLPQLTAFANGGLNAVDLNNVYRKVGFSAGVRFSWLLRDGGRRDLNHQQNVLRRETAASYSSFTKTQLSNYESAYVDLLERTGRSIALLDGQVGSYQQLLETYRTEFAVGQLSVIDYLNVLRTYAELGQQRVEKNIDLLLLLNEANYRQQ